MNQNPNSSLVKPVVNFIARYNLIIFIIIIVSGLGFAVIITTNIVQQTYSDSNYSNNNSVTFDEATINKVNQLYPSDNNPNSSQTTSGRTDIFSE